MTNPMSEAAKAFVRRNTDATPNLPVSARHDAIDGPRGDATSVLNETNHVGEGSDPVACQKLGTIIRTPDQWIRNSWWRGFRAAMCREVPPFLEIAGGMAAPRGTRYPILGVPHQAAPRVVVRCRTKLVGAEATASCGTGCDVSSCCHEQARTTS